MGDRVGLGSIFWAFATIGGTSFGGGVVAYLRDALVVRRHWLDDDEFLAGLELSQTIPGLIATNMSVYVGERLRGAAGAAAAFAGMVLPGLIFVLTLGILYGVAGANPSVSAVLHGIAAAAVGFLFSVVFKLGRKHLHTIRDAVFLAATVALTVVVHLSLPLTLLVLAPLSLYLCRPGAHTGRPIDHAHHAHLKTQVE